MVAMRITERVVGIEEFIAVAEAGSFVAASVQLGLTPSGVGKAVQRLEARLGLRLFTRTTRRVALTDAGALFLERCRRLTSELNDAEAEVDARRVAMAGPVRISAPVAYGRLRLMPALASFLKAHPEIELDLRLTDRVIDPVEERVDLVVRIAALKDSGMWARRIDAVRFGVFAARNYLDTAPRLAQPGDLAKHCLLGFVTNAGTSLPFALESGPQSVVFECSRRFVSTDIEATLAAAVEGLGLVYAPTFLTDPLCASGALRPVLEAFWTDGPPVHLIHPQPRQMPRRVRACADHLVSCFESKPLTRSASPPARRSLPASSVRRSR
jgi:LysR family transcriptional regulator, regulator for bpeEF and oprC